MPPDDYHPPVLYLAYLLLVLTVLLSSLDYDVFSSSLSLSHLFYFYVVLSRRQLFDRFLLFVPSMRRMLWTFRPLSQSPDPVFSFIVFSRHSKLFILPSVYVISHLAFCIRRSTSSISIPPPLPIPPTPKHLLILLRKAPPSFSPPFPVLSSSPRLGNALPQIELFMARTYKKTMKRKDKRLYISRNTVGADHGEPRE